MKLFAKTYAEQGIRFYPVPTRFFNILFFVEDWQGDGFIRFTFILFWHAFQLTLWFNLAKHKWRTFEWQLVK
jgi:hypothetical protein